MLLSVVTWYTELRVEKFSTRIFLCFARLRDSTITCYSHSFASNGSIHTVMISIWRRQLRSIFVYIFFFFILITFKAFDIETPPSILGEKVTCHKIYFIWIVCRGCSSSVVRPSSPSFCLS